MPKQLALKIYAHIKDSPTEVSQEYIIKRATSKGTDMSTVLSALAILHKMKTIHVANKKDGTFYTIQVPKTHMQEQYEVSTEQKEYFARLDKEYDDMCASLTPQQHAYADSIFEGVAQFIWIGDSLVPAINEEHFRKVLRSTLRGTRQVSLHKKQQVIWQ